MFKDIYKAANDDIRADSALLEKVLRQKKRKKKPPVLKYSSIAAACAAAAISLAAATKLLNTTPPLPVNETAVVTPVPAASKTAANTDDKGEAAEKAAGTEMPENKNETQAPPPDAAQSRQSAPAAQVQSAPEERQSGSEQQYSTTERQNQNAQESASVEAAARDGGSESAQARDADEESAAVTEDIVENSVTQKAENTVSTYVKTAVLCVNSEDYGGYASGGISEYGAEPAEGGYESAEWSLDDYYDYLGENVGAKLSLPPDFTYIGGDSMSVSLDSNGVPSLDSMIFPYEGSDGRSVTVMTSKNTLSAQARLEDERYKKSDINGSAAVVIGGEGGYKCYMAENGVSYIVTARGVSEDELSDILISIGG